MLMQDPDTGASRGYLVLYHDPDIPAIVIPPAPHDDCLESNIFEDGNWYYQGILPVAASVSLAGPVPATPAAASVPLTFTAGFGLASVTTPAAASVPASPEAGFALLAPVTRSAVASIPASPEAGSDLAPPVTSPAAVSVPVILTPGIAEPTHHLDNCHEARVIGQMMYDVINVSLSN